MANFAGTAGADLIRTLLAGGSNNALPNATEESDMIFGGAGGDTIASGAGFDFLFGQDGDDVLSMTGEGGLLSGDQGNDRLTGTGFSTLLGSDGNDTLVGNHSLHGGTGDDLLIGADWNDSLHGGSGNDSMSGGAGNDYLEANDGNDTVDGGSGNDRILGFLGNDRIIGGLGNDRIDGGEGFDTLTYAAFAGAGERVFVNAAQSRVVKTVLVDGVLVQQVDTITSIDEFLGSAGHDRLIGSGLDETFTGGLGSDTIDGGDGFDTVMYAAATQGIVANLATGTVQDGQGGTDRLRQEARGNSSIEFVIGGAHGDRMTGDSDHNWFRGLGGADTLDGGAGIDLADYSADPVTAGAGILVNLSSGAFEGLAAGTARDGTGAIDRLISIEQIRGSAGADRILGSSAANEIFRGMAGADTLDGGLGTDVASHRSDQDADADGFGAAVNLAGVALNVAAGAFGAAAAFSLAAGRARDGWGQVDTLLGIESAHGSMQRDILQGTQRVAEFHVTTLAGHGVGVHGADRSVLRGLMGADTLVAVSAADGVIADHREDAAGVTVRLDEGWAEDGWGSRDTLVNIHSAAGSLMDDLIVAHAGGSWMAGNAGHDTLQGGAGFDIVAYRGAAAGVSVNLATGEAADGDGGIDSLSGIEFVAGSSHADTLTGDGGENWFLGARGADTVDGAGGEDWVSYYSAWRGVVEPTSVQGVLVDLRAGFARDGDGSPDGGSRDVLTGIEHALGSHLDDTLIGTDGANQLWGAEGNDQLDGRLGADTLVGGLGNDTYLVGAGDKLVEEAGGGTDTVLAGFTYTLGANLENLTLTGAGASGGTGNAGANLLLGNAGANALRGGDGADTLHGGGGADTLFGEGGSDVLRGDAGADVFRFDRASHSNRWGMDTILDFEAGVDRIALENNAGVLFAGLTPGAVALGAAQSVASAGSVAAIYTQISAITGSTATLQAKLVTVAAGTAAGTYLYVNDGQGAVSQTTDMLIRLDQAGGTVSASDFVFF